MLPLHASALLEKAQALFDRLQVFIDFLQKSGHSRLDRGHTPEEHIVDHRTFQPLPQPFDEIQVRAVGREKHQTELIAMGFEKRLNQLGMVNFRVV